MTVSKRKEKLVADGGDGAAIISTSDRSTFRQCRRKWNWQSHLREGLQPKAKAQPLWFGSAFHHWLEDYHGARTYTDSDAAITDYVQATTKAFGADWMPETLTEDVETLRGMARHYQAWLKGRDGLKTYKVRGEPQVEVPFEFEIPLPKSALGGKWKRAVYKGVIDRVVEDENGYLWLVDYKTASRLDSITHLELDSQIGVYLWAASYIYRKPVIGFIYMQFLKAVPAPPALLSKGGLSTDKRQRTTHALYRAEARRCYGDNSATWPSDVLGMVSMLAAAEFPEEDNFIKRHRLSRPSANMHYEAMKILAEVEEMLNPSLQIYPSPNFLCTSMCGFVEPCIELDRGEPYREILASDYAPQTYGERNDWRKFLRGGRRVEKQVVAVKGAVPGEGVTAASMKVRP